jgi:hypothetical protein
MVFFSRTTANFCKNFIITLVLGETIFSAENSENCDFHHSAGFWGKTNFFSAENSENCD